MKSFVLAAVAAVSFAGAAVAQESSNLNLSDSRIELNTNFNGDNAFSARTGVQIYGYESFVEGTISNGRRGNDYEIEAGQALDLGPVRLDATAGYTWGATNGADLFGFGDTNTWGDVDVEADIVGQPGLIGNEYVWIGADIEVDGLLDYTWTGGDFGVGYTIDVTENTFVDTSVSWGFDDSFAVDSDPELNVGVGFKF